jgi:arabinoxylan arabinofuranohydrolase
MRKVNNDYYFIYSSELNHELCYATSKSPIGPFTYGGTIISNADIGYNGLSKKEAHFYYGNNHGSIVKIKEKWYVFYHRQTNRHEYSRQACAEEIHIDRSGKINQVEMTSCGLNNGPLFGEGTYSSHIACNLYSKNGAGSYSPLLLFKSYRNHPYLTQSGVDRESNPNQYIANIRDGSTIGFKYFNFTDLKQITITIGGTGHGQFNVYTNLEENAISTIPISIHNNVQSFSSKTIQVRGSLPLYFIYTGTGSISFFRFTLN